MTKTIKDGWHEISGYEVYVEDGCVLRGVWDKSAVYPFRKNREGGWDDCSGLTVAAFRAGVARETITMM